MKARVAISIALFAVFILGSALILADGLNEIWLEIRARRARASSTLVEKGKPPSRYRADKAFDGSQKTAWCKGKKGAGIGEWVKTDYRRPVIADNIVVLNGYGSGLRLYYANNRVKHYKMTLYILNRKGGVTEKIIKGRFNDNACARNAISRGEDGKIHIEGWGRDCEGGSLEDMCACPQFEKLSRKKCLAAIKDECGYGGSSDGGYHDGNNRIKLKRHVCLKGLKLEIRSVYRGKRYNDTCVAEIQLVDTSQEEDRIIDGLSQLLKKSDSEIRAEMKNFGHSKKKIRHYLRLKRELKACL